MKTFKIFVAVLVATLAFSFNAQAQKEKKQHILKPRFLRESLPTLQLK